MFSVTAVRGLWLKDVLEQSRPLSTFTSGKELNREEISLHLQTMMGYLGADSQFKMFWLSLSFLTYFALGSQGMFFTIKIVFLWQLRRLFHIHSMARKMDLKRLTHSWNQIYPEPPTNIRGWSGNRGEPRSLILLSVFIFGVGGEGQSYTLLMDSTDLRSRKDRLLLGSKR